MKFLFNIVPARVVFAVFGCLGIVNLYMMRVNLSVAMVSMVNSSAIHSNESDDTECEVLHSNETSSQQDGEFIWDETQQNLALGAFFWGYMILQLPGGRIAEMFSGKWTVSLAVLVASVLTIVTPVAANGAGFWGLVVVRVFCGLSQGVCFPALNVMVSHWSPPSERSRTTTLVFAGGLIGTVVGISLSGVIAALCGWAFIFYIFGASGIVWLGFWILLVYDSPDKHPWISCQEKEYIESTQVETSGKKNRRSPPWLKVFKSMPMWAIIVAHFCQNWGFYTLLTQLPTYLSKILKMNMKEEAFLSALPYLTCWVFSFLTGNLCDLLLKKKILATGTARKLFHGIGQFLPGIFLFAITRAGCDKDMVYAFLIAAITFQGAIYSGYTCNHLDIGSNYAGSLLGVTNAIATIPGFAGPAVVGAFTKIKNNREQWSKVFYIAAAINVFSTVFYAIFAKGEEQPWNIINESEDLPEMEITDTKKEKEKPRY